jgi:hypothetical protein
MAVSSTDFASQVDNWTRATEARLLAVFRDASQTVIAEMQKPVAAGGNMPIDTGYLRSSLQVALNEEPTSMDRPNPNPNGKFAYDSTVVTLTIGQAKLGDTIYSSYHANYAGHVEYGANGRPGRAFVRLAAAQWPRIVRNAIIRAKNAALAGFAVLPEE